MNFYYQLNERIWGLTEGRWVASVPEDCTLDPVPDIETLRARIRFYGGALGDLATIEDLRPGPDYELLNNKWVKVRFSKLAFFGLFTMAEKVRFKTVIADGNMVAGIIHDALTMADFIDVRDPATVEALNGLASDEGGNVLTLERAAEILAGVEYAPET